MKNQREFQEEYINTLLKPVIKPFCEVLDSQYPWVREVSGFALYDTFRVSLNDGILILTSIIHIQSVEDSDRMNKVHDQVHRVLKSIVNELRPKP